MIIMCVIVYDYRDVQFFFISKGNLILKKPPILNQERFGLAHRFTILLQANKKKGKYKKNVEKKL